MKILSKSRNEASVLHFCGYSKRSLSAYMFRMSEQIVSKPADVTIITFGQENIFSPLIEQLKKSDISYINPAVDVVNWKNTLKPQLTLNALNNVSTQYAVILDSADVVLTEKFINIVDRYQSYGKDIVFSGNSVQFPNVSLDSVVGREGWGTEKYLNSGCVIGKVESLKSFYTAVISAGNEDNQFKSDQYMVRSVYDAYKDIAAIDYQSKCFQSMIGHTILSMDETSTNYIIE